MVRAREQLALEFLDELLTKQEIDQEQFYGLVRALDEVSYLTNIHPTLNEHGHSVQLSGTYTGDKQIGCARDQTQRWTPVVSPEIKQQVIDLYADLSAKTGFEFYTPAPNLNESYCTATVLFGEPVLLQSLSCKGKLEIILYQRH